MKKVAIGFGKFLLGILTFILCIALLISTIVTVAVADVRVITDKDNVRTLITEFLLGSTPAKGAAGLPVAGAHHAPSRNLDPSDVPFDLNALASGDTSFLIEFVYDMVEESSGGELGATLEEVKDFVEETTIDDYLAEKGASLVSDFVLGEDTTSITVEEIKEVLEENAPLFEETFQIPMDEAVISETITAVEESGVVEKLDKGGLESLIEMTEEGLNQDITLPDGEDIMSSIGVNNEYKDLTTDEIIGGMLDGTVDSSKLSVPQAMDVFRTAISERTLWMCIGVCAVLIGLIFLTRWKKYYVAMIVTGVTLLIAGVVCMIPAVLVWSYPDAVANLVPGAKAILRLVERIVDITYPVPLGVGIAGLVLIVGGCVLSALSKKWAVAKAAKKAALAAEAEEAVEVVVEEAPEVAEEVFETVEEAPEVAEETPEVTAEEVPETAEEPEVEEETPAEAVEEPTEV